MNISPAHVLALYLGFIVDKSGEIALELCYGEHYIT